MTDEAHRGTGDYAYAQVVRYMMQHNPHHRILALTATPGGKPEAVQEIVDALHISHIEIRSETDPDLKKYLHTKHEQEHFVEMTEDIVVLRDALSAVMVVCPSQQINSWPSDAIYSTAHHQEGPRRWLPEERKHTTHNASPISLPSDARRDVESSCSSVCRRRCCSTWSIGASDGLLGIKLCFLPLRSVANSLPDGDEH